MEEFKLASRDFGIILACTVIASLAAACAPISSITIGSETRPASRIEGARRPGPPPHAPAHGYRQKHHRSDGGEVDLVFDSGLGVYVVVGVPGRYYWDGYYLRVDGDQWYASVSLDGDWEKRGARKLPPGLQKKTHKHKKSHPAKGRW